MQRYASHFTATATTLIATVTWQAADVLIGSIMRHDCGLTHLYRTAIFDPAFLAFTAVVLTPYLLLKGNGPRYAVVAAQLLLTIPVWALIARNRPLVPPCLGLTPGGHLPIGSLLVNNYAEGLVAAVGYTSLAGSLISRVIDALRRRSTPVQRASEQPEPVAPPKAPC